VLATALLRPGPTVPGDTAEIRVNGFVAPGFEEVRTEFERNFVERGEIGAAVAAYWRGEKVVDMWGGRRTPNGNEPWNEDTMVVVMSTTKGLAAMTLAIANARGWLDYESRIARYWPEFAQGGKEEITVRQLLAREAGLVLLDEKLPIEKLLDLDYVEACARSPDLSVDAGNPTRLSHIDTRVVHAGAHSSSRPKAPDTGPFLP
jgi:CubicO group peptidase (beta-lactamase class C family)